MCTLKSQVVAAGDIDLVEKKKLTIVSFVESIHDISEGFLTYDDRQDITAHQYSVDLFDLYSDHLAVHLNALKENLLEEYKKRYDIEEMPTARVTRPQATATPAVSFIAPPAATANVQVSLKTLHAIFYVKRGAERGGAEVDPEAQERL